MAVVGQIEDVVVHSEARGRGIGKKLISLLTEYARSKKCYKVFLNCDEGNAPFYEKSGFKQAGFQMRMDF